MKLNSSPSLTECQIPQESTGILHPDTSFGLAYAGTSMARNWYRDVKYPLIPGESGSQRGMTSE